MPHFIGYNLIIRRLHNKANLLALHPLIQLLYGASLKQNGSGSFSIRSQQWFQLAQQR